MIKTVNNANALKDLSQANVEISRVTKVSFELPGHNMTDAEIYDFITRLMEARRRGGDDEDE